MKWKEKGEVKGPSKPNIRSRASQPWPKENESINQRKKKERRNEYEWIKRMKEWIRGGVEGMKNVDSFPPCDDFVFGCKVLKVPERNPFWDDHVHFDADVDICFMLTNEHIKFGSPLSTEEEKKTTQRRPGRSHQRTVPIDSMPIPHRSGFPPNPGNHCKGFPSTPRTSRTPPSFTRNQFCFMFASPIWSKVSFWPLGNLQFDH